MEHSFLVRIAHQFSALPKMELSFLVLTMVIIIQHISTQ
uniref:Uncharacterized protein n=1 Tax=Arundo donax TaxID=35708 RepID=A0A0A9HTL6_ARUDO